MKYIIDTNVISELKKKQPNEKVSYWFDQLDTKSMYLSSLTIGELRSGAIKKAKKDKKAGEVLLKWVDSLIIDYEEQIIGVDLATCEEWAQLLSIDGTNVIDSLLAAQAINANLILVTRNIKHFTKFGVKLLNPFDE